MTGTFPEQQQASSEVRAPGPGTGARGYLALALVLSLILGGLAGFFLGRGTAPEKTITKSVQVNAPAYATSSTVKAAVLFDGTTAAYSGPAEVKAGTVVEIALKTEQRDALLIVGLVDPGITWERVVSYTSTNEPDWISDLVTSKNFHNGVTTPPLTEGVYVVSVLTSPSSTNRSNYATMIRVTK